MTRGRGIMMPGRGGVMMPGHGQPFQKNIVKNIVENYVKTYVKNYVQRLCWKTMLF